MITNGTTPEPSGGGIGDVINGVGDVINSVTSTVGYWSDPWGNTFKALQDAAKSMVTELMPALTEATLPDLTTGWFIEAYKISFATAIFGALVLLVPQFVKTARGTMSGRELVDSLALFFPVFLLGGMFGPAFGIMLVNFFHSLSDVFVSWGITGSIGSTVNSFQTMIDEADPVGIAGGIPIAVLLMLAMVIGLFLVLCALVVQLVTLYFTGVLMPLALLWIIDPAHRSFGVKLVKIWLGILAAHPLLFLLLGLAFSMMAGSVGTFGNHINVQKVFQLLAAIVALFVAALSPLLLLKFAPVLPTAMGAAGGPSISPGQWGPNSISDATNRYQPRSTSSSRGDVNGGRSTTGPRDDDSLDLSSSGGGLGAVAATRASRTPGAGGSLLGSRAQSTAGATTTAAAASTGTGAAVSGAEVAAAAGAAETATGAGAAIGVPTLLAAGAIVGAGKVSDMAQAAGNQAADAMQEPKE